MYHYIMPLNVILWGVNPNIQCTCTCCTNMYTAPVLKAGYPVSCSSLCTLCVVCLVCIVRLGFWVSFWVSFYWFMSSMFFHVHVGYGAII